MGQQGQRHPIEEHEAQSIVRILPLETYATHDLIKKAFQHGLERLGYIESVKMTDRAVCRRWGRQVPRSGPLFDYINSAKVSRAIVHSFETSMI